MLKTNVLCSCADCKKSKIKINRIKDEYVKYNNNYYFNDCLKKKLLKSKYSNAEIENILDKLNEETVLEKLKISEQENKRVQQNEKNRNDISKQNFNNYLSEIYNISLNNLPYSRIASVVNGTYKGLSEGISYDDLLEMFKRQRNTLDKIAYNKKTKKDGFTNDSNRLLYDMAIIVSKYDSYKQWKSKQKLLEVDKLEKNSRINYDKSYMDKVVNCNRNQDNLSFDFINDIIDY